MSVGAAVERRASPRVAATATCWSPAVRLRPGREADIVDVSAGGVLLEARVRLMPGSRVDLDVGCGRDARIRLSARVLRCRVAALLPDGGIVYQAALAFDREMPLGSSSQSPTGYSVPTDPENGSSQ